VYKRRKRGKRTVKDEEENIYIRNREEDILVSIFF